MKKLKIGIVSLLSVFALAGVATPALAQSGECSASQSPAQCIKQGVTKSGGQSGDNAIDLGDRIKTIVNMILYILGAIAVIMIVIGGVRYTTSGGDAGGVSGAKNTIIYAVVGLVIAILAYAIVNFVLDAFL
jgi:uncharacterized membrane protein YjgN (DUF898 family)